jgi:hypothetical protein
VSNITLPRAAEQVRKALELALESQFAPDDAECEHGMHYRDCSNNVCVMRDCKAAFAALDAALAEPQPEPDALRRWVNANDDAPETEFQRGYDAARRWVREVGLPALAEPPAKPEPATYEQVYEAYAVDGMDNWHDYRVGWLAAERFHGIGGSK